MKTQTQNPVEKYTTQLTRVSVFGKFELLNRRKQMQDLLTVEQRNTRRLAKIHKLKRENRTLSSRRKELIKATALDSKIWLKTVTECILTG